MLCIWAWTWSAHVDVPMGGAQDFELVARNVERCEEGNRVDVIPMRMRDEDAALDALLAARQEMIAEPLDARAGVEDEELSVGKPEADAGRVTAVLVRVPTRTGEGATHAPELESHLVADDGVDLRHECVGDDGLQDVSVRAHLIGALPVELESLAREHDDLEIGEGIDRSQPLAEIEPVELRHHDVQ